MTNYALLNNIEHKDLRVITTRSAAYGDNLWYSQTFYQEFAAVQRCYPIFFQKDLSTGRIAPIVLFGFEQGENLYLDKGQWLASYIPLSVQRLPFAIGFQNEVRGGTETQERIITIDLDSPKVSTSEGIPLFLEFGGNSDYLENAANVLESLHQGLEKNNEFMEVLEACKLIEPFTMEVSLSDGSDNSLVGLYAINEERLKSLPEEQLLGLFHTGFLEAIYMFLASHTNLQTLVNRKDKRVILRESP